MKSEVKEKLFDIATDMESVSGRIQDVRSLVSMMLTELTGEHSDNERIETLANVVIDMLDCQGSKIQYLAEKIYDIYYKRKGSEQPHNLYHAETTNPKGDLNE